MKYLKKYKIFESDDEGHKIFNSDDIIDKIDNINYMFLDLQDIGFNIVFDITENDNLEVGIRYKSESFTINDELKEFLFRLKHYMNDCCNMSIYSNQGIIYLFPFENRISSTNVTFTNKYPSINLLKINFTPR